MLDINIGQFDVGDIVFRDSLGVKVDVAVQDFSISIVGVQ